MNPRTLNLLNQIDPFLQRTRMAESRFGRSAVNDPRFVPMLRDGRKPGERTSRRVRQFIQEYGK